MKIITHEDIKNLNINPLQCYEWVLEGYKLKDTSILPPKISLKPELGSFYTTMPCIIREKNFELSGGVKIVSRIPERIPSLDSKIIFFDPNTGNFKAIIDGNWITAMRTGAVAAHTIKLLAKKNFKNIGIMGLGNTARATLSVLQSLFHDRFFNVKLLKYKNQEVDFKNRFSIYNNLRFEFCDDLKNLISTSDVVISAITFTDKDFCEDSWFPDGILVVPIHTRGFSNCDIFFDKVYGDDYGHISGFKFFNQFKSFAEICDVVKGEKKGRENESEKIIAYNIGIALHDVVYAKNIYHLLENNNKLKEIEMKSPNEKFWV